MINQHVKNTPPPTRAEAEKHYLDILKSAPDNAEALSQLAELYMQTGRSDLALPCMQKACATAPANADFANNLGMVFHASGNLAEALKNYQRAVELRPQFAEALSNLGGILYQMGRGYDAVHYLEEAVACKPDYLQARQNLGKAYRETEQNEKAIVQFKSVLDQEPHNSFCLSNLGFLLSKAGRFEEAIEYHLKAVKILPNDCRLKNNLSSLYRESGRAIDAVACCLAAIKDDPTYANAYVNCGVAYQDLGEFDKAETYYLKGLSLKPFDVETLNNIGSLYMQKTELEKARTFYRKALLIEPTFINAQWNMAIVSLALGDYESGWSFYECGFGDMGKRGNPPFPDSKKWRGESLIGQKLMIWGEQGLGDQLQFVRYVQFCKDLGAEIIVLAASPLQKILATHPAISQVVEKAMPKDFDYHIAMLSLPNRFNTQLETIPAQVPYLFTPPEARNKWAGRFPKNGRLKVGLVWAGNALDMMPIANLIDRRRSISLAQLRPLLDIENIDFISLQMGKPAAQIDTENLRDHLINPMGDVTDFVDTAAIIENLDLVISVDTSVVHLTGALGKPVWVLSRHDACWRWLNNREGSPWYPTARVFGQPQAGDWPSVIAKVKTELALLANNTLALHFEESE